MVRLRQGRPRGATGPRLALHGRHPGPHRIGWLADVGVLHARRAARSTPAPTSRPRNATACRPSGAWSRRSATAWEQRTRRGARTSRRPGRCRPPRSPPGRIDGRSPDGRRTSGHVAGRGALDLRDALIDQVVRSALPPGFDPEWGGFGPAPKFPRPSLVELCLRHAPSHRVERSRADGTDAPSTAWRAGGIYDHLVGGFCRYSTDARWLVPHFEKMLTDQALLARAYLHAWQETGRDDYLAVVDRDAGLRPPGPLHARGRALLLLRRRRRRRRGRPRHLHARRAARPLLARSLVAPAAEWYGITAAGNWEGRSIPCRPSALRSAPA